jgi:hypothetical protein
MKNELNELLRMHSGADEVEITEDLIKELVETKNWKREDLEGFAKQKFKFNKRRNTIIVDTKSFGNFF